MNSNDLHYFDPSSRKRIPKRKPSFFSLPKEKNDFSSYEKDDNFILSCEAEKENNFSYFELLNRIYENIKQGQSCCSSNEILKIDRPIVNRSGTRRVIWSNFETNCKTINRTPKHVNNFIQAELGTIGNIGEKGLSIQGRYNSEKFKIVLLKYITEYVTCKTCAGFNTILVKENRIEFKVCKTCGSVSSVVSLKSKK